MKEIFAKIVRNLKDDNTSLKAVQRLLINSVGERDYSAQETCHLLLQLPMFKASLDFIVLSSDRSRAVEEQLDEGQPATALSILDHYIARPATPRFQNMKLLHFAWQYTTPKELGSDPSRRRKDIVVIACPYLSPEPNSPNYEQYCSQRLMLYNHFHQEEEFLGEADIYAAAYATFLQPDDVPPSLEDDIHRLEPTPFRQQWQECNTLLLIRCPWLEERPLVKLTSISVKCFLTMVTSCLEAAPACCLETWPAASSDGLPSVHHSLTNCPLWPWQFSIPAFWPCYCPRPSDAPIRRRWWPCKCDFATSYSAWEMVKWLKTTGKISWSKHLLKCRT